MCILGDSSDHCARWRKHSVFHPFSRWVSFDVLKCVKMRDIGNFVLRLYYD